MKTASLVWLMVALTVGGVGVSALIHEPGMVTEQSSAVKNVTPEPTALAAVDDGAAADGEYLMVPGKRFGRIPENATRQDLVSLFGKASVKDEELYGAEGITSPGTVLFPDDPERRAEIFWDEDDFGKKIATIRLQGEKSRWHTPQGITLGSTLKDVVKVNGSDFKISGFWWDYGGTAFLENFDDPAHPLHGIGIRFSPMKGEDEAGLHKLLSEKEIDAISGDGEIATTSPVLQKLNPPVTEIFFNWVSSHETE